MLDRYSFEITSPLKQENRKFKKKIKKSELSPLLSRQKLSGSLDPQIRQSIETNNTEFLNKLLLVYTRNPKYKVQPKQRHLRTYDLDGEVPADFAFIDSMKAQKSVVTNPTASIQPQPSENLNKVTKPPSLMPKKPKTPISELQELLNSTK